MVEEGAAINRDVGIVAELICGRRRESGESIAPELSPLAVGAVIDVPMSIRNKAHAH